MAKFFKLFKIYSLYDTVSKDYGKPYFCTNDTEAINIFEYACTGKMNLISPDQFVLFQLGTYDANTGTVDNFNNNLLVKLGSELENWKVKSKDKERDIIV